MCHCGAVVKEFLARADKSGSTPGDAAFCFFVPFFSLFFHYFSFWPFFFILTADPASDALGSIYILSLSLEFYFGKGISISKVLDLHTGQAYDQKKKNRKKNVLYLRVNLFSTKVLIGDTIFYVSYWRRDRHFTWSSEPREGLAACSTKVVPSFLSYFKILGIGPAPGIEPATSRSAATRSTD